MLTFLDTCLELIFAYAIPVLIGIAGIGVVIGFLAVSVSGNSDPEKSEITWFLGIIGVCIYGFFSFYFESLKSIEPVEGWQHPEAISTIVALFFMVVFIFFAKFLRAIGIPNIIIFLLYLGIAIFGI